MASGFVSPSNTPVFPGTQTPQALNDDTAGLDRINSAIVADPFRTAFKPMMPGCQTPQRSREAAASKSNDVPNSSATPTEIPTPQAAIDKSEEANPRILITTPDRRPATERPQTQAVPSRSGDRDRTEMRYKEAVEQLKRSCTLRTKVWKTFDIPDFQNLTDLVNPISELRKEITKTLDARDVFFKDGGFWSKAKQVAERIFIATIPFAKIVLSVAKEGANVFPAEKLFTNHVVACIKSIRLVVWWTAHSDYGTLTFGRS